MEDRQGIVQQAIVSSTFQGDYGLCLKILPRNDNSIELNWSVCPLCTWNGDVPSLTYARRATTKVEPLLINGGAHNHQYFTYLSTNTPQNQWMRGNATGQPIMVMNWLCAFVICSKALLSVNCMSSHSHSSHSHHPEQHKCKRGW